MKVLFDTSVLVAAIIEPHPMHNRALPWLKRARKKEIEFFISCHSLAELYAVLTTLPVHPRISPQAAWRLIREDIEKSARIISISSSEYIATIKQMADLGVAGGCIYDALIARAARKANVDRLLTFDTNDFMRIWPKGEGIIFAP